MRDLLFYDKHRFAEFLDSPEGISTNILAERLARLETRGLIERRRYQDRPPRDEYVLTTRGYDLLPVLKELITWGQQHVPGVALRPPPSFREVAARPDAAPARPARSTRRPR